MSRHTSFKSTRVQRRSRLGACARGRTGGEDAFADSSTGAYFRPTWTLKTKPITSYRIESNIVTVGLGRD